MSDLIALDPHIMRTVITLVAITILLSLNNRRFIMVPLAVQYILVAFLVSPRVAEPLFAIRLTLGVAISAILYITANRMEGLLGDGRSIPVEHARNRSAIQEMGPSFRVLALGLGALLAFGIWSGTSFPVLPVELSLTAFWLSAVGLCLLIVSSDPLRMGIGILVFINGAEAAYFTLEASLLVVATVGMVDILVALAIAYVNENWLESLGGEAVSS
jgi:hypothetical protein